jgi:hypothetical protein
VKPDIFFFPLAAIEVPIPFTSFSKLYSTTKNL